MEKEKLEQYKTKLFELREIHQKEKEFVEEGYLRNSQRDASGDLSAYSIHMADVAADSYERDKDAGLANNLNNILYEINEALYRVEKGEYGICESCHRPINEERLQAMPYARLCIECKKRGEKKED
ncbi:MAG: TraR/DksA C4-type zinc finger protein [bacterium]